jgi:hypothetical protein
VATAFTNARVDVAATTLTLLYTVPAATSAVVHVLATNRNSGKVAVRIAVAPLGAADAVSHYKLYDYEIPGNDFQPLRSLALKATDELRVYSDTANVTFSADIVERT